MVYLGTVSRPLWVQSSTHLWLHVILHVIERGTTHRSGENNKHVLGGVEGKGAASHCWLVKHRHKERALCH